MITSKGRISFTSFRIALIKAGDLLLAKELLEDSKQLSGKQDQLERSKPLVIDLDKSEEKSEFGSDNTSENGSSQRSMINIGNNCFVVAKTYKGELNLESEQCWHLGGGVYAKINSEYPTVNIRHYWKPDDAEQPVPTKRGVMLNKFRLDNLRDAMEKLKEFVPEIEDAVPCMYGDDHMNQEGMLRCPECAFAGPEKLYKVVKEEGKYKIGRTKIRRFLNNTDIYSLSNPIRRTFDRTSVVVDTIDSMWDGDLADMTKISKYNNGYKFLLVLIDIFSRFLMMVPLKNKSHSSMISAFQKVFDKGRKPKTLRTDKGSEFKNRWVKSYLHSESINTIYTQNETKANYAERVIRTMKNIMYRYFMKFQTYKYIDVLDKLVDTYNTRPHRSLGGMLPKNVNPSNADEVRLKMYLSRQPHCRNKRNKKNVKREVHYKLKLGDTVRISQLKKPFQKDYDQKWTEEYFKIYIRYKRNGIPVYRVKDLLGEKLQGSFYEPELQRSGNGASQHLYVHQKNSL
ncbi:hypothetical protein FSP39_007059 [Pinctada imbricata]|uniref:Integrase catalytic domain-containing protein n=1 Tax=Pinctada imbricata TaxID=66713 RepID=A0AA89C7X3_PINIB|nr:hypothetical protein FSP39_007059 [Pinctada imbricata]